MPTSAICRCHIETGKGVETYIAGKQELAPPDNAKINPYVGMIHVAWRGKLLLARNSRMTFQQIIIEQSIFW